MPETTLPGTPTPIEPPPQPQTPPRVSGGTSSDGGSFGRDVRLIVGAIMLLGNLGLIYKDIQSHEPVSWPDVVLHGSLLIASLLLMDPKRLMDLLAAAKDYIPFIGKSQ
jgi:hypothetical protein